MNLSNACQYLTEKEEDILSIILSGSRARGDYKEDSDYDFIFVTKSNIEDPLEGHEITKNYIAQIARKTAINEDLIKVYLWPLDIFKEEHKKGNSFVYCTLRDGKVLSSKCNLNLKQPNNCHKAAIDRMNFAKRNIEHIEFSLKILKDNIPHSYDLEDLGYCSMHLCWAICMFNNFCPISKHTVLKECKKYFDLKEFECVKKTYQLYANKNKEEINKKTFLSLFNNLKMILKRIEKDYVVNYKQKEI